MKKCYFYQLQQWLEFQHWMQLFVQELVATMVKFWGSPDLCCCFNQLQQKLEFQQKLQLFVHEFVATMVKFLVLPRLTFAVILINYNI